jgi:hypothetical protein
MGKQIKSYWQKYYVMGAGSCAASHLSTKEDMGIGLALSFT